MPINKYHRVVNTIRLKASISLVPEAAVHAFKTKEAYLPFQETHLMAGSL